MGNKQMEIRFVKILMFFAMLNIKIKTEKITGNMTKIIKITDCLKPEKKEIFKMTYQSDSNLWFVTFKCVNDAIPLGLNNESIPLRSLYYCDKETNEYVRKNKGPRQLLKDVHCSDDDSNKYDNETEKYDDDSDKYDDDIEKYVEDIQKTEEKKKKVTEKKKLKTGKIAFVTFILFMALMALILLIYFYPFMMNGCQYLKIPNSYLLVKPKISSLQTVTATEMMPSPMNQPANFYPLLTNDPQTYEQSQRQNEEMKRQNYVQPPVIDEMQQRII